jgi:hypothetical protein
MSYYAAGSPGGYNGLGTSIAMPPPTGIPGTSPAPGYSYDDSGNLISLADERIDISIDTTALTPALPSKLPPAREQGGVYNPWVTVIPEDIAKRGPAAAQAYRNGKRVAGSIGTVMAIYGIWRAIRRRPGAFKWWGGGLVIGLTGGMVGRAVAATA